MRAWRWHKSWWGAASVTGHNKSERVFPLNKRLCRVFSLLMVMVLLLSPMEPRSRAETVPHLRLEAMVVEAAAPERKVSPKQEVRVL